MSKDKFEPFKILNSVQDLERVEFNSLKSESVPIIFDTNFLFVTFEFKLDIISEIQRVIGSNFNFYIYEGTLNELVAIENRKTKNKHFLPLISKMLSVYNFKIIKSDLKYVDDQILKNISDRVIIATNDKELRLKIWEIPGRVLYMRQKKYLEIK